MQLRALAWTLACLIDLLHGHVQTLMKPGKSRQTKSCLVALLLWFCFLLVWYCFGKGLFGFPFGLKFMVALAGVLPRTGQCDYRCPCRTIVKGIVAPCGGVTINLLGVLQVFSGGTA